MLSYSEMIRLRLFVLTFSVKLCNITIIKAIEKRYHFATMCKRDDLRFE